jgi:hypothetical protein
VFLGRLKCALPGWEEAESRRVADTAAEASCRTHASGSGGRGFDADSWGAGYGGDVGRAGRWPGVRRLGCWKAAVAGCNSSCGCLDAVWPRSPLWCVVPALVRGARFGAWCPLWCVVPALVRGARGFGGQRIWLTEISEGRGAEKKQHLYAEHAENGTMRTPPPPRAWLYLVFAGQKKGLFFNPFCTGTSRR